jgi:ferritin
MPTIEQAYKKIQSENKSAFLHFPWEDKAAYSEWLAQTYFYAKFTTRIISLAGALFHNDDPLHYRFLEHAKEEKNHEKILLSDLKVLGKNIDQFRASIPALCLYQTQYYWIQNVSPIVVYGYFLYLEGLAIEFGADLLKKVESAHPENGIKFIRVHVEEDKDHMEQNFKFVKALGEAEQKLIIENMNQTGTLYKSMMTECAGVQRKMKAA